MDQATLRFVIQLLIIGFTFFMLINASALLVLAERKIMGFMQQRYGPYLVGPHGLLQPLADILKLLFKEELRPKDADKWLFTLAPIISVTTAFAAFAAVPWGAETTFFGLLETPVKLGVADVNVAVLVVFAITSMGVYGIVLAGWSSNSKYSLLGGLRSSAQMISYELAYATALAWVWFLIKVGMILFTYIWVRWTVPRYRYDQLMQFGWKWLFPAAVLNLIVTAALILYFNA